MNKTLQNIYGLIETRKTTAYKLCKEAGIPQSTFASWKSKDIVPSTKYLQKIADYFDVSVNYLLNDEENTGYYLDPKAAEIAQEVYERPELRMLFDASRKVSPEDLKLVIDMVDRLMKD